MKQLFGGLALGVLLGAGGLFLVERQLGPDAACEGLCGDGTRCEAGRCVIAEPEPDPAAVEPEESEPPTKRKGKRRRGKGKTDDEGEAGDEAGELASGGPPLDDASGIPHFDANKDQLIGASDGSERLSQAQIDRELDALDSRFQACVRDASQRVSDLGTGTVKFSFGVSKTGKVTGVNASAPVNLELAGIEPCVRKAIYARKFPAFNGPEMKVSSSFSVR